MNLRWVIPSYIYCRSIGLQALLRRLGLWGPYLEGAPMRVVLWGGRCGSAFICDIQFGAADDWERTR